MLKTTTTIEDSLNLSKKTIATLLDSAIVSKFKELGTYANVENELEFELNESITMLKEIFGATANPNVAIELFLGIYEDPAIEPECDPNFRPDQYNKELISYNKWTNEVEYAYEKEENIGRNIKHYSVCRLSQWNKEQVVAKKRLIASFA